MIFDLSTLHLGDVLLALPAMRAGDAVIARPDHRVPGAPVAWLDAGAGAVRPEAGRGHETLAWIRASGRRPVRHALARERDRHAVVIAPHVRLPVKQWPEGRWTALRDALPDALVVDGDVDRQEWMHCLSIAHTVICPDTGTAHMADALGVPRVIALHGMGRAHFERYHPYWTRGAHCIVRDSMGDITVADVLEMIDG